MSYVNDFPCSIEGCPLPRRAKMYCINHYTKFKKWGDPLGKAQHGNNLKHTFCTVEDCGKKHQANGLCQMHYRRVALYGDVNAKPGREIKGSRLVNAAGYIAIYEPENPNSTVNGYVLEHRKVMAETLGRPLVPCENVHHKNGIRHDNTPNNLELWNTKQPIGQRPEDKVSYALEILRLYAPELLNS